MNVGNEKLSKLKPVPRGLASIRYRGGILLALALLHVLVPQLEVLAAIPLTAAGILNVAWPSRAMFILNGLLLIALGVWNALGSGFDTSSVWGLAAVVQWAAGAEELGLFLRYRPTFRAKDLEPVLEQIESEQEQIDFMVESLRSHRNFEIRRTLIKKLASMGSDTSRGIALLTKLLKSGWTSPALKCWIHYALARIQGDPIAHWNAIEAYRRQYSSDESTQLETAVRQTQGLLRQTVDKDIAAQAERVKKEAEAREVPKFCRTAAYSLVFAFFYPLGFILAVIARIESRKSKGRLKGRTLAWMTIASSPGVLICLACGALLLRLFGWS